MYLNIELLYIAFQIHSIFRNKSLELLPLSLFLMHVASFFHEKRLHLCPSCTTAVIARLKVIFMILSSFPTIVPLNFLINSDGNPQYLSWFFGFTFFRKYFLTIFSVVLYSTWLIRFTCTISRLMVYFRRAWHFDLESISNITSYCCTIILVEILYHMFFLQHWLCLA